MVVDDDHDDFVVVAVETPIWKYHMAIKIHYPLINYAASFSSFLYNIALNVQHIGAMPIDRHGIACHTTSDGIHYNEFIFQIGKYSINGKEDERQTNENIK